VGRPSRQRSEKPKRVLKWALGLGLLSAAAYGPVRSHEFINFDDPQYVFENPHVSQGVSPAGLGWAFTSGHAGNWHPLTWISHMIDADVHGLNPGGHHVTNVLIHALNTSLLFLLLVRLTGTAGPSAFAAGLFGLHPLHVESVAWVAERKDMLSTFFWLATLMAYARYVKGPTRGRYAAIALLFGAGLMSKPTVVTLPLVLLLLDFWPLQRHGWRRLILEKLPLVVMSFATGLITLVVQQQAGAVRALDALPLGLRMQNAVVAYAAYLGKTIWPTNLAPLYPYDFSIGMGAIVAAAVVLAAISTVAIVARRRAPYIAVGWGWYLITLAPMIGIIQVGSQPMADRYTYVPLIGIFMALAWGLRDLTAPLPRRALMTSAALLMAMLAVLTWRQSAVWRDSVTLWRHTLRVTAPNYRAHTNLGQALGLQGRWHEALPELEAAVRLRDTSAEAQYHLANTLSALGQTDAALARYRLAATLNPHSADVHGSLGIALAQAGLSEEGMVHMREAARLAPSSRVARANLAIGLNHAGAAAANAGEYRKAIAQFSEAIALDSSLVEAYGNLGAVHVRLGDVDGAIAAYREAARLQPANPEWQRRIDLLNDQRRARGPGSR
jgi:tetratricopeptide (TPR) repeat protein